MLPGPFLALLVATLTASTPDSEPPNIWAHAVAPRNEATDVPTNARLWVSSDSVGAVTLSLDGVDLQYLGPSASEGIPLDGLEPLTSYRVTLDDRFSQARVIDFTTGAGPDTDAPASPTTPEAVVCSYFTECDPGPHSLPGEESVETFRITLTLPSTANTTGVALYRIYVEEGAGEFRAAGVTRQSTFEPSTFGAWQEAPERDRSVTIITHAEIGDVDESRRYRVTSVDLAGNESPPSEEVSVELRRSTAASHPGAIVGCSAVGAGSLAPLALLALLGRRRRR